MGKTSKPISEEQTFEDYKGLWVKIKDRHACCYYRVRLHTKQAGHYLFFYTEFIETTVSNLGKDSGGWYYTKVAHKDYNTTCVIGFSNKFQVLTTEQVNVELDMLRKSIPVIK